MFSILITQFYDNLSTVGPRDPPHLQLFSNNGVEISNLNPVKIKRINLMRVCHVLLILLVVCNGQT